MAVPRTGSSDSWEGRMEVPTVPQRTRWMHTGAVAKKPQCPERQKDRDAPQRQH